MSKKLRSIVLVDDNETTSFLNNRLLSRLDVAEEVHTFRKAEQAFQFLWGGINPAAAEIGRAHV